MKTYLVCLSLPIVMLNSATFITEVQFKSICFSMHTFNHSTADNSKRKIDQLTKKWSYVYREYVYSAVVYQNYLTRLRELIIFEPWRENYHFSQPS